VRKEDFVRWRVTDRDPQAAKLADQKYGITDKAQKAAVTAFTKARGGGNNPKPPRKMQE